MVQWFIDRNNKIPLYLQLKELIKYYISTGAIQENQRLPTVSELAQILGVNFETVRKAYKELAGEGLISTTRGQGTFRKASDGHPGRPPGAKPNPKPGYKSEPVEAAKKAIRELLQTGLDLEGARSVIGRAFDEITLESSNQLIIFTECNLLQIREISELLRSHLEINVKPVLLENLNEEVAKTLGEDRSLLAVITTGFHINEVRHALADSSIKIDFVITNMSPETRREVDAFDKTARFGYICRDTESISFYRDMLKAELGLKYDLTCCILEDERAVKNLLESTDVLLVSPPVYEEIRKLAPPELPVFNVFDRVDPMSLMVIKDRIDQSRSLAGVEYGH